MSDDWVLRISELGKRYKIFSTPIDNFLDALGISFMVPWRRIRYREFWALKNINLELRRGQRLGIIGRNGAGKSTLLKLITRNLTPTTGKIDIAGQVYALMDTGGGFHPEFTGRENIRAALTYQGLDWEEMAKAEADIIEFTELEDFIEQPLKTYSMGMQARLAFATATAVTPDIVIIDEVLGAGDAYFMGKSTERIQQISDRGASMIVVSHSMMQITQICNKTLWLDAGEMIDFGKSLDVTKAYERHIRELEDQRLQAKNAKHRVRKKGIKERRHLPKKAALSGNPPTSRNNFSYWPGEGSIRIIDVSLLNGHGDECAVFPVSTELILQISFKTVHTDIYRFLPVAVFYRIDGINVSCHVGDWEEHRLIKDRQYQATLNLGPIHLGNSNYVISVALYKEFDPDLNRQPVVFDWIDRSMTFKVVGNAPAFTSIFMQHAKWRVE